MPIIKKIIGLAVIGLSIIAGYIGYLVAVGVGAIGGWAADMIGVTGAAHTGITLLAYFPVLGVICAFYIIVAIVFTKGVALLRGR